MRSFALVALAAGGCVFEERCVGGAVREVPSLRCVLPADDAGRDAGAGELDAGPDTDAGMNGGMDAGPPRIVDIAVGAAYGCVVDSNGVLTCWGANQLGILATGDVSPRPVPQRIDLGAPVIRVGGNTLHVCAETSEPALYCWGGNGNGMIGDGTMGANPVTTPFRIGSLGAGRDLEGSFANTCFVSLLGTATCWGRNDDGQVGVGTIGGYVLTPGMPVMENNTSVFENLVRVTIADRHVCFTTSDRSLHCMGRNQDGELGTNDGMSHPFPILVPGLTDVTSVSAATSHTCAVSAGDVYCWGSNVHGEAVPGAASDLTMPTLVTGIGPATQVATGGESTCALLATGEVTCWGWREFGSIGDGMPTSNTSTGPVMVPGLSNVVRLESSYLALICALTADDEIWCWGTDAIEQIGGAQPGGHTFFLDGTTQHTAPVRVDPF